MYYMAAIRTPKQASNTVYVWVQTGELVEQENSTSGTIALQLSRWLVILEQWERALQEQRETICMMDANLDFLTWSSENLPSHHSSVKLGPLTQALFTRILPLGVVQMVTGPTRAERGVPATGLDHLYGNRLSGLEYRTTKFLARKFSKDFKRTERYTRKRV